MSDTENVGEQPDFRPGFTDTTTAASMAARRWQLAKPTDPTERAVAALVALGRAGLREMRRTEAAGKGVSPGLIAAASKPWSALVAHYEKTADSDFARGELAEAKRLLSQVRAAGKRRA